MVRNETKALKPSEMRLKPFLRWAGGKRQLLPVLLAAFPGDFVIGKNHYYEPFVGGGAVLMALHGSQFWGALGLNASVHVNDINHELICTYQVLKETPAELIRLLQKMSSDISEAQYYRVRSEKPRTELQRAARFIYLNRLCFNGLHRVNSKGEFNVPYGKLSNPKVCDTDLLIAVSSLLQSAEITQGEFSQAVRGAKKGDLVYFDPPYVPLTQTASFSKYSRDDFGEGDQRLLAKTIDELTHKGVHVVLSNSSAPLARQIFQGSLNLYAVRANRSISASATSRNSVNEVLGISYDISNCSNPAVIKALKRYQPLSVNK